ncbi:hypothetical protein [Psychromicrobium xiongbiense]|uniref:hypothetical protein n=1 Tax=Psychromicrobium xiongbiense TaxID=3051184 RepID=UPI0025534F3D|nr:hypothetical protein [Psychromicrobium sp. YIM S02556]
MTTETVGTFAASQFERARIEFFAWFEVAQHPDTATNHPLVIERFGDTLDPEDAAAIFEWWSCRVRRTAQATTDTHALLAGGGVLDNRGVEVMLSMIHHTENIVRRLLDELEASRLQDA